MFGARLSHALLFVNGGAPCRGMLSLPVAVLVVVQHLHPGSAGKATTHMVSQILCRRLLPSRARMINGALCAFDEEHLVNPVMACDILSWALNDTLFPVCLGRGAQVLLPLCCICTCPAFAAKSMLACAQGIMWRCKSYGKDFPGLPWWA
eukprot:1147814-Pelagomonas_calceolata.AAC.3